METAMNTLILLSTVSVWGAGPRCPGVATFAPYPPARAGAVVARKPAPPSLYSRLGGEQAVSAVVDDFVARAASNPKVNFTRQGGTGREWEASPENVARLKKHLAQFI